MDPISATLMTYGVVLLVASWIYLMIISFREDFAWGLTTVLVPPLSFFYSFFAWSKAKEALWLGIIGLVLIILA